MSSNRLPEFLLPILPGREVSPGFGRNHLAASCESLLYMRSAS